MPTVDAIPGSKFEDSMTGSTGVIAGVYESTDFEDGEPVGTTVYVDLLFDGNDDPIRVPLQAFQDDDGIEIVEVADQEDR